ncbi:hypothetical protein C3432_13360 [Citrobacter amalonaticus]|uniref:Uncharacterized protein n=1 Tax=Citrobacter amalonaticus TaxID=35703 RepID=A0A2S4RVT3_CITAM|nr:hypothetical protein C3432_13360 [Citrobacter amalonaticus]POT74933.1 hypothetical protein C3436_13830 [Citrobacter amalonaticus]POU64462.1 hypothetical protein C3430_14850 [Citrobacter amalonaticus]POV04298.1 hypothetical protein C3424_14170 [Citrobacter amalonaticus]
MQIMQKKEKSITTGGIFSSLTETVIILYFGVVQGRYILLILHVADKLALLPDLSFVLAFLQFELFRV